MQGQHYKLGFLNDKIINVMTSDGGSVSKFASSIRFVVQQQLSHCWMGQTPCDEGFIGINAVSASISDMFKEILGINVDAFAHLWVIK